MYEFQNYKTNYWKTFLPRLENIQIKWSPEKILNDVNLKELTYKNWNRMVEVGVENCVYYSLNIINDINRIIGNSDRIMIRGNSGSCCPGSHFQGAKHDYIKYFIDNSPNGNISKNLKQLHESTELLTTLYNIKHFSIPNILYDPLYKPSQTIFKFNLEATPDEIKNIYLKFIDTGLYKGLLHIFDKYGRCILSNENKNDIEQKSYSQQDYKRIEDAITTSNQIDIKKYLNIIEMQTHIQNEIYMDQLEMKTINQILDNIPNLEIMQFLKDYIKKITESYSHIFTTKTNTMKLSTKGMYMSDREIGDREIGDKHKKSQDQFNIHRHLSTINAQIETEINSLVYKITTTDKLINKYVNIMSNLGYFKQLYEEYKKNNENELDVDSKSDAFRYNKKEETMQGYIKYLNDIINQLKNQKLSNPLNKDKIRQQFREFLQFGENIKLFKHLDKSTREIYDFARLLKSKHKYKVLFPEMVSSILHYLLIVSLVNLFDIIDNSKVKNDKTDTIEYKFIQPIDKDNALEDYSNEMDINLVNEDTPLDEDGQPMDLIESFEFKNSNNLKVIGKFIITYLDYVDDTQNTYDELTNEYVKLIVTKDNQKKIENTLRTFEWLNMENHEDIHQMAMMQMRMKKVNYAELHQFIKNKYGDDFLDEENDEYPGIGTGEDDEERDREELDDEEDDGERDNNEYGMDKYELENEFPQVYAMEDMEDADMDYDMIGVGEDD